MKIRRKEKLPCILRTQPGDVIRLLFNRKVLAKEEIKKPMELNAIAIFDVEKNDFGDDVQDGIGGAFLNLKEDK